METTFLMSIGLERHMPCSPPIASYCGDTICTGMRMFPCFHRADSNVDFGKNENRKGTPRSPCPSYVLGTARDNTNNTRATVRHSMHGVPYPKAKKKKDSTTPPLGEGWRMRSVPVTGKGPSECGDDCAVI